MQGETMRLAEIGFVDAQRRTPGPYAAARLSETATAGAVLSKGTTVPDGLDRLAEAAAGLVRARSLSGKAPLEGAAKEG